MQLYVKHVKNKNKYVRSFVEDGSLQPDNQRFPSGIRALADYVHSLGLKFGIYEDYGTYTCGGYPGVLGHLEQDAKSYLNIFF